jgi:triacylglycerol lipase
MSELSPSQSAQIASRVYAMRKSTAEEAQSREINALGIDDMFGGVSRFTGTSGGMYKPLSGFGYVAAGVGKFAGDVLIATRGTVTLYDWVTDGNCGLQRGPGGEIVHGGFHETWKSFAPALQEFLRGRNPTRIHCVGHSLGGGLAFLNADFIRANRIADVRVYTFGSPRVGFEGFSRQLTERVGKANIYRVSNPCDPVPMIPYFPFFHAPHKDEGLQIGRTSSMPVSFAAHYVEESYVEGVKNKAWGDLHVNAPTNAEVKAWLDNGTPGAIPGSAKLLDWIGRAITSILGAAGQVVAGAASVVFTGAMTILDRLAWMLNNARAVSLEIGHGVQMLIGMIFKFLGRTAMTGVQITTAFLRWVLDLLFTAVRAAAHRALAMIR